MTTRVVEFERIRWVKFRISRFDDMYMIGLSRVGSDIKDLSHFRAETSRYLAPYLEHFQAFLELQNSRRKTSRRVPEVNEDRKSISDFNLAHRSPISLSTWMMIDLNENPK